MIEVTPSVLDLVIIGLGVEFAVMAIWMRRRGAGQRIAELFFFLASGAALMIGLRFSLSGGPAPAIGAAMLAAGVMHAVTVYYLVSGPRANVAVEGAD